MTDDFESPCWVFENMNVKQQPDPTSTEITVLPMEKPLRSIPFEGHSGQGWHKGLYGIFSLSRIRVPNSYLGQAQRIPLIIAENDLTQDYFSVDPMVVIDIFMINLEYSKLKDRMSKEGDALIAKVKDLMKLKPPGVILPKVDFIDCKKRLCLALMDNCGYPVYAIIRRIVKEYKNVDLVMIGNPTNMKGVHFVHEVLKDKCTTSDGTFQIDNFVLTKHAAVSLGYLSCLYGKVLVVSPTYLGYTDAISPSEIIFNTSKFL